MSKEDEREMWGWWLSIVSPDRQDRAEEDEFDTAAGENLDDPTDRAMEREQEWLEKEALSELRFARFEAFEAVWEASGDEGRNNLTPWGPWFDGDTIHMGVGRREAKTVVEVSLSSSDLDAPEWSTLSDRPVTLWRAAWMLRLWPRQARTTLDVVHEGLRAALSVERL